MYGYIYAVVSAWVHVVDVVLGLAFIWRSTYFPVFSLESEAWVQDNYKSKNTEELVQEMSQKEGCTLQRMINSIVHYPLSQVLSSSFSKYNKPSFYVEIGFIYFQLVVYYLYKTVLMFELLSFSNCESCLGILSWDWTHYNFSH